MNIHSSLAAAEVVDSFKMWDDIATAVAAEGLSVVIFLDEVNTASCLGLFMEICVDHTLMGQSLSPNLVVIAACNPARGAPAMSDGGKQHDDLGKDWALGHYQVHKLPESMEFIKWQYVASEGAAAAAAAAACRCCPMLLARKGGVAAAHLSCSANYFLALA